MGDIIRKSVLCWLFVGALAVAVLPATGCGGGPAQGPAQQPPAEQAPEAAVWTCPMHPEVREAKPGPCRICGMDLVPVEKQK